MQTLKTLNKQIESCQNCPRLIQHCHQIAQLKKKSFAHHTYWGGPVASFGDENAQLIIVGLAPAAHGANRTGRLFTGDQSGLWLYRALYEHGFSNQAQSENRQDGLKLINTWITNTVHCAPPANHPLPSELEACFNYFNQELGLLKQARVYLTLGKIAFDQTLKFCQQTSLKPKPKFSHGTEIILNSRQKIVASFHPSQQNTFTKRLTKPMFDAIFTQIKTYLTA